MTEPIIGWVNNVFAMDLASEDHLNTSYPVIILTILDAVYQERVPWHKVDWRFQYARALERNYEVLSNLWHQLSMEKSPEFRHAHQDIKRETQMTGLQQASY